MPNYTANRYTPARASYSQGDASEWTRYRRLSTEAVVMPYRYNPYKLYRSPFPAIQKIFQGIQYPSSGAGATPGPVGDWARAYYLTTSGGDPTLDNPASWGTPNPSAAILPLFQKGADGELFPYANATGLGVYDYAVIHLTGYFRPPVSGSYVFDISSDDGFQLKIGGTTVIDSRATLGNMLSAGPSETTTPIPLTAGVYYPIDGLWVNGTGGLQLVVNSVTVDGDPMPGAIFDTFFQ